jgi:hypothetical protein
MVCNKNKGLVNTSRRLILIALAGAFSIMCGSTGPSAEPSAASSGSSTAASGLAATTASAAATLVVTASPAPTTTACPSPTPRLAARLAPLPTPVAAFAGDNGGSKVFAIVESVDVAGQRITFTFADSGTSGLGTAAALTARATLRVTSSSVLQQIVAHEIALTAPVLVAGTRLAIADGAPALPARAPVIVIGLDGCGAVTSTVRTTLTQAVAAGTKEWTIATALGTLLPRGAVICSETVPLALSDLKEGDVIAGPGGALIFGLLFDGRAPDYVLTRLLGACRQDPCPAPPA